jgi:NitT/TauT family transport system ATP-binding protein
LSGNPAFIQFLELAKSFTHGRGPAIPVVEPLSLAIAEGEFVVLVGPSGCGKTTVMRMVGGLEVPTTGEVRLDGRRVVGPSREKGMVFQTYSSFPWLTVLGNIRFGMKYRRDLAAADKDRIAHHYLDLVGLTPFADFHTNRISKEALNPLGRIARPEEIAAAAVFLAGPGATFMTGQCVSPNGGAAMF